MLLHMIYPSKLRLLHAISCLLSHLRLKLLLFFDFLLYFYFGKPAFFPVIQFLYWNSCVYKLIIFWNSSLISWSKGFTYIVGREACAIQELRIFFYDWFTQSCLFSSSYQVFLTNTQKHIKLFKVLTGGNELFNLPV